MYLLTWPATLREILQELQMEMPVKHNFVSRKYVGIHLIWLLYPSYAKQ